MSKTKKFLQKWFKRWRMLFRLILFKLGIDKRPVFAVLTVTSYCNFKCKYCFADYHTRTSEKDLPTERILKTIDELVAMGVVYVNVHGGEALIRKDVGEIIRYALKKGLFVNLITNGTLLKRRWEDVKDVDVICVSVDGTEENNDKNRGQGTYKIATEAIDFALAKGATVRLGMTITKHTMNDMEALAGWARERNIYLHPYLLFDQENLPKDLWMTREENHEALKRLIELKKKGYPIFYSTKVLQYALDWPFEQTVVRGRDLNALPVYKDFKFIPCLYKRLNVLCESNATVRACNAETRGVLHVSVLDKTVAAARDELLAKDDCLYCYHLPQTEMSLLFALDAYTVFDQFLHQIKEDVRSLFAKKRRDAGSKKNS